MALGNRFAGFTLALVALSACGENRFELYPEDKDPSEGDLCAKVTCKASDACHAAGVCDPTTGECSHDALADGTACDDGNACTYNDSCRDGACSSGGDVDCRALDDCHAAGKCDPKVGCSNPAREDGAACGDDDACTADDHCAAGKCTGTAKTCAPAQVCFDEGMCNAATGECVYVPKAAGSACDPGEAKNCATGQCDGNGTCVQTPVTCKPLDSCHEAGVCDPDSGACSNPVKDDGASCDDGDVCTAGDICRSGVCGGAGATTCPALDACHLDGSCQAGVGCVYANAPDGTGCEDGDLCTLGDSCQKGTCDSGAAKVCTASGPCERAGSCDSTTGQCSQTALADGTSCDDGDQCTRNTTCAQGACAGGAAVTCTSNDPCKLPIACDSVLGCQTQNAPDGTSCEEGNLCTEGDSCLAGVCKAGSAKTCAALNGCHLAGDCDPGSGLCSVRWADNGTSCDDNNGCTSTDACNNGQCVGKAVICNDPCLTDAACDPNAGRCVGTPVADGTTCEGDSLCASSSSCQAGACTTKTSKTCTALDSCHQAGACDEVSGECTQPTAYSGAACANGFCFTDVAEQAGLVWPEETTLPLRAAGGFFDANVDGLLDVLFVSEARGLYLFVNDGSGAFDSAPMPTVLAPTGASAADYDNDGDVDLFVTSTKVTALLRNDGAGAFTNVASAAGVAASGNATAATFADFDADGFLDLYVGNQPVPGGSAQAINKLYRNLGNGKFSDVTSAANVGGYGRAMAVLASDVDGDGYPEILVCNDFASGFDGNIVYANSGSSTAGMSGRFSKLGSAVSLDCLGGAVGDFDRDGDSDYYWAVVGDNALWSNAASTFTNVASSKGVTCGKDACTGQTSASWEAGFYDFDADGWLDLYVSRGGDVPGVSGVASYIPDVLFRNDTGTSFTDVALSAGAADARRGRGVAFGDYDGDGDVDILQLNAKGSPLLLKNQTANSNGWAALTLEGTTSNRDGIGAQVLWSSTGFSRLDERRANAGTSGPSEARLFTGLGSALDVHAELDWPSGIAQHLFYLTRNATSAAVEPALTITSGVLGATTVKRGTSVSATLTMSAAASGGTYSVRLYNGQTKQTTTLATPVLAASKATLSVTVGATATTGASTLVVSVTDGKGGKDELLLPVTITP
jgi:hypothetical protein